MPLVLSSPILGLVAWVVFSAGCFPVTGPRPGEHRCYISGVVTGRDGRPASLGVVYIDTLAIVRCDSLGRYVATVRATTDSLHLSATPDPALVYGVFCTGFAWVVVKPVVRQDIILDHCTPI
jgi:hypothetical protein